MKRKPSFALDRRQLIKAVGGSALGSFLPQPLAQAKNDDRKFLFIICATGGASIVDSFLAQDKGLAAYSDLFRLEGSPFSACPVLSSSIQGVIPLGNRYPQMDFLKKYSEDMIAMTCEVSSVNHFVAAKRAITGDNVFGGKTLGEAMAIRYGADLPLANLMLAGGGYAAHGDDPSVPDIARAQVVSDPLMFAFATHGFKGVTDSFSSKEIEQIRTLRKKTEKLSRFYSQYEDSPLLQNYLKNREHIVASLERRDTITKLMMLDENSGISAFGLKASPDFGTIQNYFPDLAKDPFAARMALGFLATKHGLSTTVSIAPSQSPMIEASGTPNSPIAFDWSHVDHRGAQNAMWSYLLKNIDALISLLKATDYKDDPSLGKMWDRSLIYIATEFGRDRVSIGGSGHHLNNGVIMISPMLAGNRIYGGIDAETGLTYGFDTKTAQAIPGVQMKEKDIYSAVATAMGLEFKRRTDLKLILR